jgi:putative nucleotidyltransferase with HDIG domain
MTTETIDNKVRQVVSNIRNLPTPPIVFHQIQKIINEPSVSAAQIATVLSEDPAMSVKVLKLTNSAFYGLSREIESVKEAVVIVGMEAIKNLVLSASVLDMFKGDAIDQEFQEKYWRHSLATAFCSKILARKLKDHGMVEADAAFSAGLLHDIGKMVIACFLPEQRKSVVDERVVDKQAMDFDIEERVLGYSHAHIGGFLAEKWKLPHKLIDAITCHHTPQLSQLEEPLAPIIYMADFVAKDTFYDRDERHLVGTPDPTVMESLGVKEDDFEMFRDLLKEEYVKAETFMHLAGVA